MITQRCLNFKYGFCLNILLFEDNPMVMKKIPLLFEKIATKNSSVERLAITFCVGVYIGLSPFVGVRTLLTLFCGWFFALDFAILFTASFLIHNPWTMIPLCVLNHIIGQQLFGFFDIDGVQWDPSWAESVSLFIQYYTGISGLSLSAFLVGGNLLGISISVMLYPFIKRMIFLYKSKKNNYSMSSNNCHIKMDS